MKVFSNEWLYYISITKAFIIFWKVHRRKYSNEEKEEKPLFKKKMSEVCLNSLTSSSSDAVIF